MLLSHPHDGFHLGIAGLGEGPPVDRWTQKSRVLDRIFPNRHTDWKPSLDKAALRPRTPRGSGPPCAPPAGRMDRVLCLAPAFTESLIPQASSAAPCPSPALRRRGRPSRADALQAWEPRGARLPAREGWAKASAPAWEGKRTKIKKNNNPFLH